MRFANRGSYHAQIRLPILGTLGHVLIHAIGVMWRMRIRRNPARSFAARRGCSGGRRATTHWSAFHLLPFFGATPVNERVVADGNMVFAAGGTSGIDGALRVAAMLRGDEAAKAIQLIMQYAPEPPFNCGIPETAPPAIVDSARRSVEAITTQRAETARRVAKRLGIAMPPGP